LNYNSSDDDYWTSLTALGGDFQLDVSCTSIPEAAPFNEGSVEGTIEANSFATYTFSIPDKTQVLISTCDNATNFDTKLILYKSDCSTVVVNNDDAESCTTGNTQSTIDYEIMEGGDFCLKVQGWGSDSGTYKLTFEATSANSPTVSPTKDSGCLKSCYGLSCSEVDALFGTEGGFCDFNGTDLVSELGCSCASCDDCNTLGVEDVSVKMFMTASTVPEGALSEMLQTAIAAAIGVSIRAFKDFQVSSEEIATRMRRRLASEYLWSVSFQVSVSLGATSSQNGNDLADSYNDALSTTNFTSIDKSLTLTSSVSTKITLQPTSSVPVSAPTAVPAPRPSSVNNSGVNTGALVAGIVGSFLALVVIVGLVVYRKKVELAAKKCYAHHWVESQRTTETESAVEKIASSVKTELELKDVGGLIKTVVDLDETVQVKPGLELKDVGGLIKTVVDLDAPYAADETHQVGEGSCIHRSIERSLETPLDVNLKAVPKMPPGFKKGLGHGTQL